MAVVISGRLWGRVREYKCVNSRIMWVKLKVNDEKVVIVGVYKPGMKKSENGKK